MKRQLDVITSNDSGVRTDQHRKKCRKMSSKVQRAEDIPSTNRGIYTLSCILFRHIL